MSPKPVRRTALLSLTPECRALTARESSDVPPEVDALTWDAVFIEGVSDDLVVSAREGIGR